ncbi:glycosyltransferase family protein [Kineosporia babensis]|uniref:Glycosyltransferase n=1 Tax=Kineosporia babensis TaxID=499548 RepID=A0A9X1NB21_9ACTN|nr:glycosyltransferase [Kineosporia babensis]
MRLKVLQIPGEHPYVRQVCPGRWRFASSPLEVPSLALTPEWIGRHHHEFDLVHLHFGYEHLSADEMQVWIAQLGILQVPLVLTVHDLRNPHQLSSEAHDRHLDLLVPAAAAVITLTTGAAAEIRHRWGRKAQVLEHPAVFGTPTQPMLASGRERMIGIHFKDLRRNVVEPDLVVEAALIGAQTASARLRVDLHPGVRNRLELRLTRGLAEQGLIDLAVHERFSDPEFAAYLQGLHAYVLPNRFGTHSGWLEACRDLGTRVVAPSCGYYADQWDEVVGYQHDETFGLDPVSLSAAVQQALTADPVPPADPQMRARQLTDVRRRHEEIYRGAVRRLIEPRQAQPMAVISG